MNDNVRTNVIINLIRTITLTILSFITFPFACRILGDEALGLYTWANTFVYYFLILAKISIPNIAIRECVKVRNNKEMLSHKAQEFFVIQAVMTILSFVLMMSIIFSLKGELFQNKELIFILSINFIVGLFSFEWIFIALEKHFYMAFRSIVVLTISAILIFSFVRYKEDIYIYAFLTVSVTILTVLINLFMIRKYISFKKTSKYNFKQYFKPLVVLFLISLVLTLYNQTDSFILGFLDTSKAEVGSYSVGIKGVEIIITIITSLSAVFIPRATYYYSKENKTFFNNLTKYSINICFFIAIPAIATMTTLANPITSLISGSYEASVGGYEEAGTLLVILVSMVLTYSIGDIIYSQVLIPMEKEKIYLWTMLIGVVLNISLSLIFGLLVFKDHPAYGVAIATMGTDVLILVFLLIKTRSWTSKAIFNFNSLKIIVVGLLIGIFTYFVGPLLLNVLLLYCSIGVSYLLEIAIMVICDAIIYLVLLGLAKENLVYSFLRKKQISVKKPD